MMPWVIELFRPKGLPMAMARSPTRTASESASASGTSPSAASPMCSTARSLKASAPRSVAFAIRPSCRVTSMLTRAAHDVRVGDDVARDINEEA